MLGDFQLGNELGDSGVLFAFDADGATDTITVVVGTAPTDGTVIFFEPSTTGDNLVAGVPYYAINSGGSSFQVSLTPDGPPVDIGSGGGSFTVGVTPFVPPSSGGGVGDGCAPIFGSDNGFLVKRRGPNEYVVVYADPYDPNTNTHSHHGSAYGPNHYRSLQMEQFNIVFNDNMRMVAQGEDEFSSGDVFGMIRSEDKGETWARVDPGAPNTPLMVVLSGKNPTQFDHEVFNVDEDGAMWSLNPTAAFPTPWMWQRSTDWGLSWTNMFTSPTMTTAGLTSFQGRSKSAFISRGWIWAITEDLTNQAVLGLLRQATDGSGATEFTTSTPSGINYSGSAVMNGHHVSPLIAVWAYTPNAAAARHLLVVDTSDPTAPVFTWSFPFEDGITTNIVNVTPITDTILVALTMRYTFDASASGAIWRSTDAGATWTKVYGYTTHINPLGTHVTDGGLLEDLQRIDTDGQNVWVVTMPPYVHYSPDQGATWFEEEVDMTIFDPYLSGGAVAPSAWIGIGVTCGSSVPGEVVHPGLRRMNPDATQEWFDSYGQPIGTF